MRSILVLSAVACLLAVHPTAAQRPWEEPFARDAAALLAAATVLEPPDKAVADGIFQHTVYHFESDRRRTITQRSVYRVLNAAAGANFVRAASVWAPWYQKQPEIKARVITADGREHWLDPKTLSEQAAPATQAGAYEGIRVLAGPLPAIADGALVEIETRIEDHRAILDAPYSETIPILSVIPFRSVILDVEAPADSDLKWKVHHLPELAVEQSTHGKRRKVRFQLDGFEAIDPKAALALVSSGQDEVPGVRFSTGGDWNEVAVAYHRLAEAQLDGKAVPGEWPLQGPDRLALIRSLVKRVHESVRYEALMLGQASIQPRRPAETLKRGYGDCKDKALLLKALLAEAGFESHLALLRAATADDVEPELPGFGQFNHAILYLPGEQPLWIDATAELTPIGELPMTAQDRWALVVDPTTQELIRTPTSSSKDNRITHRTEQKLQADGSIVVSVRQETFGVLAESVRQQLLRSPDAYEQAVSRQQGDGSVETSLDSFEADDPRTLESPHSVHSQLSSKPKGARYSQDQLVAEHTAKTALGSLPFTVWLPTGKDTEPSGLKLPVAYQSEVTTRMVPPPGYKLRKLPASEKLELGPARLETEWSVADDGAVLARTTFDTAVQELNPEEAAAFRAGLQKLSGKQSERIVFENAVFLGLRTSAFQAGLEAAQELVRNDPDDLFARTRLVDALLIVGAGHQAREEARALVEKFPDEAAAHMALGEALLQGTLGQQRGLRDLDRDGAVAAFEKALELDPLGRKPVNKLVEALTFAPDGSRFNSRARLDEALELIERELDREETSERQKPLLRQLQSIVLSYSGRYEELAAVEAAQGSASVGSKALEAAAMVDGVEAALSAAGAIEDERRRRLEIGHAAGELLYSRHYPQAQRLFEAAAQAAAASIPRDPLGERYETQARQAAALRRHEDVRAGLEGPAVLAHDWMMLPYRDDWPEELERLSGSECGESELRNRRADGAFASYDASTRHMTGVMGLAIDHSADWSISNTRIVVEGDDATGYWVRAYATSEQGREPIWMVAFIELQDGELKILDAGSRSDLSLADLGCTLSSRLERDGLDSVKVWLDRVSQTDMAGLEDFKTFWCEDCFNSVVDAKVALALLQAKDEGLVNAVIPVLEQAYRQEKALDRRTASLRGLAAALSLAGDAERGATLLTELANEEPLLTPIVAAATQAHIVLGDLDQAKSVLAGALEASPDNPNSLRWRLFFAMAEGRVADAREVVSRLEALSQAGFSDYNNVAWAGVVAGRADPISLAAIEKALALAKTSPSLINTEAALLALDGRPDRARARWNESVYRGRAAQPTGGDQYVAGLILEQYGLIDEARRAFEAAADSAPPSPANSAELGRNALDRLDRQ